ncbi:tyrosine-protein phosphatase [[Clostridium] fimetarium]|uniref:Protein-tyrosine phosphatase n=1 Tax=[Clostridium] fimetarium TaxID=99656 RepID=A0A1I0NQ24_9FIRM|nr:tyrosine-protein phosphatase [[Clostridium] fimetarium]SEW03645.1 protein-tyrosine phosphatase [[Clostridium] fimetarium]
MKYFRRYPFINAYNIRDLGGYPTNDGGVTRFGVFYRADSLANISKDEWKRLEHMNVKTIIDLRSTKEKVSQAYTTTPSIHYLHMPMLDEKQNNSILEATMHKYSSPDEFKKSMSEGYVTLFKNNIHNIMQIIKTIASALENGSVLFHCTAGKDRTGILAALLLYLCKVDLVDISADYQITYTYNLKNPIMYEAIQLYGDLLRSDADNIEALILYFHTQNIETSLFGKVFTENEIRNIRRHFVFI